MKRLHVHALFGAATLLLTCAVAVSAFRLARDERVNEAIVRSTTPADADLSVPEARFARAVQRAAHEPYDAALAAEKAFLQGAPAPLREGMLYDVGNLHLRQALRVPPSDSGDALPLVELAKQSYRDALRADPMDWDARYNLERALALSPESDEANSDDSEPPANKERTITTAKVGRKDLP